MQIVLLGGGGLFWKGEIKVINVTCLGVFDNAKKKKNFPYEVLERIQRLRGRQYIFVVFAIVRRQVCPTKPLQTEQ